VHPSAVVAIDGAPSESITETVAASTSQWVTVRPSWWLDLSVGPSGDDA
jgi:hypothetical protein